jgi:hypothetical protein
MNRSARQLGSAAELAAYFHRWETGKVASSQGCWTQYQHGAHRYEPLARLIIIGQKLSAHPMPMARLAGLHEQQRRSRHLLPVQAARIIANTPIRPHPLHPGSWLRSQEQLPAGELVSRRSFRCSSSAPFLPPFPLGLLDHTAVLGFMVRSADHHPRDKRFSALQARLYVALAL